MVSAHIIKNTYVPNDHRNFKLLSPKKRDRTESETSIFFRQTCYTTEPPPTSKIFKEIVLCTESYRPFKIFPDACFRVSICICLSGPFTLARCARNYHVNDIKPSSTTTAKFYPAPFLSPQAVSIASTRFPLG
jgi:hypothetical protein